MVKTAEFDEQIRNLSLRLDVHGKSQAEYADIAVKAFELSQSLTNKWVSSDSIAKRHLRQSVCLNFLLEDKNLMIPMQKPFDILVEGPNFENGRGERI
ncbi:MAG: hypothetical protein COA73_01955 [Candidatus Hydrogenedentota bacterium]|nr:MAG: hypothetical protein COA73_01955 [Candidatus Hydrogenedentota bacterium]